MSITAPATTSETLVPTPGHPDPEHFYELLSLATLFNHHIVKPDAPSTPIFFFEKHESLSKKKFDILIHRGDSKEGDVLGVVKLHLRGFTIGLGNPATEMGEGNGDEVIWEELVRPEKWSHQVYHFSFGNGAERKTYTYRKEYGLLKKLKSMELRVGDVADTDGELLAKWVRNKKWNMKGGSLFIKKTGAQGHLDEKWEMMVCLTTFAIIESQVRRSKG